MKRQGGKENRIGGRRKGGKEKRMVGRRLQQSSKATPGSGQLIR